MRQSIARIRILGPRIAAGLLISTALAVPALAADKPPVSPDASVPAVTPSTISATIQFGLPALSQDI
jgi:hypothetical protein